MDVQEQRELESFLLDPFESMIVYDEAEAPGTIHLRLNANIFLSYVNMAVIQRNENFDDCHVCEQIQNDIDRVKTVNF